MLVVDHDRAHWTAMLALIQADPCFAEGRRGLRMALADLRAWSETAHLLRHPANARALEASITELQESSEARRLSPQSGDDHTLWATHCKPR